MTSTTRGGARAGAGNRKDDPKHFRLSDAAQSQLRALVAQARLLRAEKVSGRELIEAFIAEKWSELDADIQAAAERMHEE